MTSCTRNVQIRWDNCIVLPPCEGMEKNVGLAGAYSGLLPDGRLAIMGGANFPDKYPWENGFKHWWKTLYLYDFNDKTWQVYNDFLTDAVAYGSSIQLEEGILCIGGSDSNKCFSDVFLLTLRDGKPIIDREIYPSLPFPIANAACAMVGRCVYLAGGQKTISRECSTHTFLVLDLDQIEKGWQELRAWNGPSRAFSVAVAHCEKFYLFSGRSFGPGEQTIEHYDGFVYDPKTEEWAKLCGSFPYMAGTAVSISEDDILFLGGVDRILPTDPNHPGFSRDISMYSISSGNVKPFTESPYIIPVTTNVVRHGDEILVVSGEIAPGIRTPEIIRGTMW